MRRSSRRRSASAAAARRWSVALAQTVLAELEESGLTVEQFAAEAGLKADRLRRWARRLRAAGRPLFVEVAAPPARAAAVPERFEVELAGGRLVRVPREFDARALQRLVEALEGAESC